MKALNPERFIMAYANRRRQRGAILILIGFALVVLVGFVGLVIDLGRMYVIKSELQSAVDACALGAAAELQGDSDQLLRAENAGITVGNRNRVNFQNAYATLAAKDIRFNTLLNGGYQLRSAISPTDAPKMRYVRCESQKDSIVMHFLRVLGFGEQSVTAIANATLGSSQTTCAVPIGLCSAALAGKNPGDWLKAGLNPGEGLTGDFMWIDFSPSGGGNKEIKEILTGPGFCGLPSVGTKVGQPGGQNGAVAAWNTRFGIYTAGYDPSSAQPDRAGFTYTTQTWPTEANAYQDLADVQRPANTPYQGDGPLPGTGLNTQGSISDSTVLQSGGNRRVVTVPMIDCSQLASGSHTATADSWACIVMLQPLEKNAGTTAYIEYQGLANEPSSPCASTGLPGATTGIGPKVPVLVK